MLLVWHYILQGGNPPWKVLWKQNPWHWDGSEARGMILPTCLRTGECHKNDSEVKVGDAWAEKIQGTSGDGLSNYERPHQDPERPAHSQQIQHQGHHIKYQTIYAKRNYKYTFFPTFQHSFTYGTHYLYQQYQQPPLISSSISLLL